MIFSTLKLKDNRPIYEQIEKHIEKAIESGALTKDSKLPSTREVSSVLGVSRNTVLAAYENLESKDLIYSVKGKGSFIKKAISSTKEAVNINWQEQINNYGKICYEKDIMKSEHHYEKGMISFKSIAPEGSLFDMEEFKRAFLDVIAMEGEKILNYGYAQGYKPLITFLKQYMSEKGVSEVDKDILITNGFTEALDIVLSSFTESGDTILCEMPTHNTSLKMMKAHGLHIVGIPIDEQGIMIKPLEEAIKKHRPRWLYITPSYQNPTGVVMSGERRKRVYELISKYQLPCIEDGFNEELLYSSSHVLPISALAENSNHIIYLGSLSKILFPGLRLGWIMAGSEMIDLLESIKRSRNIHTSFLDQAIFVQYMKSGAYERYVKKVRKNYRDKYLFIMEEIKNTLPYKKIWGEGGLHVYIDLDCKVDTRVLVDACYERGVLFMPGDIFMPYGEKTSSLRLGFARLTEEEIRKGLLIIKEEIEKVISKK